MAEAALPLLAQAGGNLVSSTATAGLQILGNQLDNQQKQNYNTQVMNRTEKAFTDAGLPKYMAYTGGSSGTPMNKFQVRGGNFYSAGPVNSNLPTFTSQLQLQTRTAKPRPEADTQTAEPPTENHFNLNDGHENIPMSTFADSVGSNYKTVQEYTAVRGGIGNFVRPFDKANWYQKATYTGNLISSGAMLNSRPRFNTNYATYAAGLQ